jgi:uncharacterized protein (TIGR00255 family)
MKSKGTENSEILSMTGFGHAESGAFSVEVRSVNHRYLEAYFRMPPFLNKFEIEFRKKLRDFFSKGRFDVAIQVNTELSNVVRVNDAFVSGIIGALKEIKNRFSLGGEITIDILAGLRDIFMTETAEVNEQELMTVFEQALSVLYTMRASEGEHIRQNLLGMVNQVESLLGVVTRTSGGLHEKIRQRVMTRFHEMMGDSSIDQNRLIQEALILADRADITEEITRLQSHIRQFRDILEIGGAVGRKLDFLLQEFFREANTMASKTPENEIVTAVIDMKNEIEKLREQVQNLQ